MKLVVLVNNWVNKSKCLAEHGFSLHIEIDDNRYLFDVGQSDILLKNAQILDLDLSSIDSIFISHSHYDHTGGLLDVLKHQHKDTNVFVGQNFFKEKYKKVKSEFFYIGLPYKKEDYEKEGAIFHQVGSKLSINDNIVIYSNFKKLTTDSFVVKNMDGFEQDLFQDELAVCIKEKNEMVIVSGCSHCGIVQMVKTIIDEEQKDAAPFKTITVMGGFHLEKATDNEMQEVARQLKNIGIKCVGIAHCSGQSFLPFVKEQGLSYYMCNVGNKFTFLK
ncbi:MAG: hypothetical protein A2Y40_05135 [Candidatus Margulisbacteria bacterium GWF2_35_9]|nr:MAG: hypothetical protein A2Y40_05135 [Candidatus Margulisbacteria bacterium GWF2_35_9]